LKIAHISHNLAFAAGLLAAANAFNFYTQFVGRIEQGLAWGDMALPARGLENYQVFLFGIVSHSFTFSIVFKENILTLVGVRSCGRPVGQAQGHASTQKHYLKNYIIIF